MFFHFALYEGLRGAAKRGDGAVTFNSLADYVADGVANTVPELYKNEGATQVPNSQTNFNGASPVLLAARLVVPMMKVPPQALQFTQGAARVESALDLDKDEVEPGNKAFKRFSFVGEAEDPQDLHSKRVEGVSPLGDATGVEIAKNDDAGNGSDSRIISKIEKAGTYHIVAMSKKGGAGEAEARPTRRRSGDADEGTTADRAAGPADAGAGPAHRQGRRGRPGQIFPGV